MKRIISVVVTAALLLLGGCIPFDFYSAEKGTEIFTLNVDGQDFAAQGGVFPVAVDGFEIDLILEQQFVRFNLSNLTDSTIRLDWDSSVIVLANGTTSRIVGEQDFYSATSFANRNNPQFPAVIPAGASLADILFPVNNWNYSQELGSWFTAMFRYPLQEHTEIKILLNLQIGDSMKDYTLTFSGEPEQE